MGRELLRRLLIVLALGGAAAGILLTGVPLCPMAGVLGVPCPGCGLTRATLALARGDFRRAFQLHPLVFVLAPIVLGAALTATSNFLHGPRARAATFERRDASRQPARTGGTRGSAWQTSTLTSVLGAVLLAATLGVWGARFFGYFGGPAPVQTFSAWSRARLGSRRDAGDARALPSAPTNAALKR